MLLRGALERNEPIFKLVEHQTEGASFVNTGYLDELASIRLFVDYLLVFWSEDVLVSVVQQVEALDYLNQVLFASWLRVGQLLPHVAGHRG